jgi:hypothetical protein
MKRAVIRAMALVDEALDEVLYRPVVVKALVWVPRWWLCDLAKFSRVLDDRWGVGCWEEAWIAPGQACEACGRRASIHLIGGWADDPDDDEVDADHDTDVLAHRVVHLCGCCHVEGPILNEEDLDRELQAAVHDSVSWRWRWRPGRE